MRFSELKKVFGTISAGIAALANGKLFYQLTTAVTPGVTTTSAAAGTIAVTTHSTGKNQIFVSDGTYWQNAEGKESNALVLATVATSAGNTDAYTMAPFTGKLVGAMFSAVDALSAHDTNYVTFVITNISNSNAAMLAATDANTSKATGGTALAANTKRDLTLNGTAGNLAVTAGDRILVRVTATGTLANTLTFPAVVLIYQRTI